MGALPKPPAMRQRRNRPSTSAVLVAPPVTRVPLPDMPDGEAWHPQTLAWWDAIWSSPATAEWLDSDVPRLVEIAILHEAFWRGELEMGDRIRLAEREFGLSPMSRRSLGWTLRHPDRPEADAAAPPPAVRRRGVLAVLR